LSGGVIAGIVIAVVAFLIVLSLIAYYVTKSRGKRNRRGRPLLDGRTHGGNQGVEVVSPSSRL